MINTADKEIYNIPNGFLVPYYFNTNRTNKHTHMHESSLNNINLYLLSNMKINPLLN